MLRLALVEELRRLADGVVAARRSREKARRWHSELANAGGLGDRQIRRLLADGRQEDGRLSAAFVVELLQWLRDQPLTAARTWQALQRALGSPGRFGRRDAAARAPARSRRPARDRQRDHEHAPGVVDRLDAVLRARQPRRAACCARIRPAHYPLMDFPTRDRYRHSVEQLAKRARQRGDRGRAQARRAGGGGARDDPEHDRRHHVGYYLISRGRFQLEREIGYPPTVRERFARFAFKHPALGTSASSRGTDGVCGGQPARVRGAARRDDGAELWLVAARRAASGQRAGHQPAQPDPHLADPAAAAAEAGAARRHSAGTPHDGRRAGDRRLDPRASTRCSTTSRCASSATATRTCISRCSPTSRTPTRTRPRTTSCWSITRAAGIDELNERHGAGPVLLLPSRAALERGRAPVDGMGAQARQARRVQPPAARRDRHQLHRHRTATGRCCRRCATSSRSTPTRSCRWRPARRLVGTLAHPLNPPRFDPAVGTRHRRLRRAAAAHRRQPRQRQPLDVREGVLRPRRRRSRTRPRSRTSTRTCFTRAATSARASTTSMRSRRRSPAACPRTRCSATICSRARTRARGCAPTSISWTTIRRTTWRLRRASTAGRAATGRSSAGSGCTVPDGDRAARPQHAAGHRALEDLRQPAPQPAGAVAARAAPRRLDDPARVGAARGRCSRVLVLAFPALRPGRHARSSSRVRGVPLRQHVAAEWDSILTSARQVAPVGDVPRAPGWLMTDAIARTLWRLLVSHRRMLEWVSADRLAGVKRTPAQVVRADVGRRRRSRSAVAALVATLAPAHLPLALPWSRLWLALAGHRVRDRAAAGARAADRSATRSGRRCRKVARRTWRFFEDLLSAGGSLADPRQLPGGSRGPDRASHLADQHRPAAAVDACGATTSDTSAPPAWSIGSMPTFATLLKLPRYRGHFYNWYDTRTLAPLVPAYVSTVDSGNLAGYLLTLKHGLRGSRRHASR